MSRRAAVFAALLLTGLIAGADPLGRAGVAYRGGMLRDLAVEYAAAFQQFRTATDQREARLSAGQGWKNADGSYGYQTPAYQAFFGARSAGMFWFGADGKEIRRFVVSYQDRTPWGILTRADGTKLTVGYQDTRVTNLEAVFADGGRVAGWGPSVQVTWPLSGQSSPRSSSPGPSSPGPSSPGPSSQALSYTLAYNRGDTGLYLTPALAEALSTGDAGVLADLAADIPSSYTVRILSAAVAAGVDLQDDRALARYAVRWLRTLVGAPTVPPDPAMEAAATSHATYLVRNAVLPKLSALVASQPEAYLGLHEETAGTPGFTGAKIWDRTSAAGYRGSYVTETANFGGVTAAHDMVSWFHSVYHRRPFLDLRATGVGYHRAVSAERPGEIVSIANWGFGEGMTGCVLYPAEGETLVPVAWAAQEAPNPYPGRAQGTGVPLSVAIGDPRYAGGRIELLDAQGVPVPLLPITIRQDPQRYLEAAPESPLVRGARYTVRYVYPRGVIEHTFTTAAPDPAEVLLAELREITVGDPETRTPDFDVDAALRAGQAKGALVEMATEAGTRLVDPKYGFSLLVPEGWTRAANRTWQEVALAQGGWTIGIQLYALGPGVRAEDVLATYTKSVTYTAEETSPIETPHVAGLRRVHGWQYAGKVIVYGLVFGEFAMGILGYGVTAELMDALVLSIEPG